MISRVVVGTVGTVILVGLSIAAVEQTQRGGLPQWEYARCVRMEGDRHILRAVSWREQGSGFLAKDEVEFIRKLGGTAAADEPPDMAILYTIGSHGWQLGGVEVDYSRAMTVTFYFQRLRK